MGPRTLLAVGLVGAIGLTLAASRAAADWLVLRDGLRVETRGPWEVRGKLLVFTDAAGRLSSLRLGEIDLDASRAATEAAGRTQAEPPARQVQEPVFVLTDADVRHRRPLASEAGGERPTPGSSGPPTAATPPETPAGETPRDAGADAAPGELVVTEWQEGTMPDDGGVRLTGTLRNRGGTAATRVQLTALIYDREGALIATAPAQLSTDVLMPDRQARFQVELPGVFDFSSVRFEPGSLDFEAGSLLGGEPPSGSDDNASGPA